MIRIIIIAGLVACFSIFYAGTLPSSFHFQQPTETRVSFVTQYKQYEGQEEKLSEELLCQIADRDIVIEHTQEEQITFVQKCRRVIIQAIAFLSAKFK